LVNGGSGPATALTTIVSIDPLYCYINVPESAALRYQELALPGAGAAGAEIQRRRSKDWLFSATGKRDEFSASGCDRLR
jgi:hypothetical protein